MERSSRRQPSPSSPQTADRLAGMANQLGEDAALAAEVEMLPMLHNHVKASVEQCALAERYDD